MAWLLVLIVLPLPGDILPRNGPASGHSTPPFLTFAQDDPAREAARALIVEVYYRAIRDDEYIAIGNPHATSVDLSGWTLTDLEGRVTFPPRTILLPGGRVVATRNATSYLDDTRLRADFTYDRGDARRMIVSRVPVLANERDEVLLRDAKGADIDAVIWGTAIPQSRGWTGPGARVVAHGHRAVRAVIGGGWADTNSSADWDSHRPFPLGQVDRSLSTFVVRRAEGFLSPDAALPALTARLREARTTAYVSVYQLTSEDIATELVAAATRGVDLRVLLDGSPVGGIAEAEWSIAQDLSAAGAWVRFLVGNLEANVVPRFRFLHAKYVVIDNETAVVGSENWSVHGYPTPPRSGNRGWHLAVRDRALARYLTQVFLDDFDPLRRDTIDITEFRPHTVPRGPEDGGGPRAVSTPPQRFAGPSPVTPILGPDHALRLDGILGTLGSATRSIDVQVPTMEARWGSERNPYLEALLDAARRGVRVRILHDGSMFGPEGEDAVGSETATGWLSDIASAESLPLEARRLRPGAGAIAKIHTKGFVVDGRVSFVSSLNWNQNSATRNRELGLLVESSEAAAYFGAAFEADWAVADDGAIPLVSLGGPLGIVIASVATITWFLGRRRRAKEL